MKKIFTIRNILFELGQLMTFNELYSKDKWKNSLILVQLSISLLVLYQSMIICIFSIDCRNDEQS